MTVSRREEAQLWASNQTWSGGQWVVQWDGSGVLEVGMYIIRNVQDNSKKPWRCIR